MPAWLLVFCAGLVTALATGLGVTPFLFFKTVSARSVSVASAVAAGLMLGASFGLLAEGRSFGIAQTVIGGLIGMLFVQIAEQALKSKEVHLGTLHGASARKVLLIVAIMTVHSFAEGVAVGVSFGGGSSLATLITIAIAVHNIPEGLAISAVMRPAGSSLLGCAGWSIFSSLPQPLMAVPAFLFVEAFRPFLPYGLGFAAGAMVYMVMLELLPEAYKELPRTRVGAIVTASLGAMILFQELL